VQITRLRLAQVALELPVLVAPGLIQCSQPLPQPAVAEVTKRKTTQQRLRAAALVAVERVAHLTAVTPVEQVIRPVFSHLKEITAVLAITRLVSILSPVAVAVHQQPEQMVHKTVRPVFQEMAVMELPRLFPAHQ
jgi:hypothetical protein